METPPLNKCDVILGDPPPPKGKVDFGVTNSRNLRRAYVGDGYPDGPQPHPRTLAYIEDVHLIQAAAVRSLGSSGLEEIATRQLAITPFAGRLGVHTTHR